MVLPPAPRALLANTPPPLPLTAKPATPAPSPTPSPTLALPPAPHAMLANIWKRLETFLPLIVRCAMSENIWITRVQVLKVNVWHARWAGTAMNRGEKLKPRLMVLAV